MSEKSEKPKKRKKKPPRIYATVRKVADLETGEQYWALVPTDGVQRRAMRERGFKKNDLVAIDCHAARDYPQWKKVHLLGTLLVLNVEGFDHLDAHKAIKKIQEDADIECDHEIFDLPGIGKLTKKSARSLSFDEMDQTVFDKCYAAMCDYIGKTYFHNADVGAIEAMIKLMPESPA